MNYEPQAIPEVVLLTPRRFEDERGFFMETFRQSTFQEHCGEHTFVQDNHSRSARGVLRGLHYQIRQPQGKLVRAVVGEILDVAVDLREQSKTYGQWVSARLSASTGQQLWVPPGFGHGFLVLSEVAEVVYKTTDYYAPECERSVRWDDLDLAIDWQREAWSWQGEPELSAKDLAAPGFSSVSDSRT
ncbi:dTDP-4-dehydrorhamnose 3,5-epimerase [Salinicola halophyticus]|uniref:dTDP-4-dehydrorhamnose 3,5-epimerase n=1 Tax=Salinicola halophyticus TaxID=1808881 RepID=UPI000DA1D857|nr:dTDP-4-dehydrorhamnose 3,5-epimerase [Salinicola halophyticus]